ncbi:MAG: tRNA (adenosine(37)-N6)-threonylcarbamoyltransferase complex dimerization subunit type 1 TsaB [bacterium]|jgi:tRNA threonylcarbamoyladenosine biosynthesis protein TsaB
MLVLAIDTATAVASVALVAEGQPVAEENLHIPQKTHSERLLPALDWVLAGAGFDIAAVNAFAVSMGPGSFTGLRIGLGTARGLAHALDKPLVTIPTLDALAYNYFFPGAVICPLLDAKQGYVYTAFYRGGNEGVELVTDYLALTPAEIAQYLAKEEGQVVLLGDGIGLCQEAISLHGISFFLAPPASRMPRAASVGILATERLRAGKQDDIFTAKPLYVRKSAAEINLQKKRQQG